MKSANGCRVGGRLSLHHVSQVRFAVTVLALLLAAPALAAPETDPESLDRHPERTFVLVTGEPDAAPAPAADPAKAADAAPVSELTGQVKIDQHMQAAMYALMQKMFLLQAEQAATMIAAAQQAATRDMIAAERQATADQTGTAQ
nr:hypothetical protein [uncultured Rhodopila sp.]